MSALTIDGLRALCPGCHKAVRVRCQGAAWRMVAHKRTVSTWSGSRDAACPVRDADAVPRIAAWIASMGRDAKHSADRATEARAEAAKATERAESCDEAATATHRRIAEALRVAPPEAVALLQADAARVVPVDGGGR